jgi:hypothetical protein
MVTPADIKLRFPEFNSVDDAKIQLFIDDATATTNSKCPNYDLMVSYLTAHLLTLATKTDSDDSSTTKPVVSESVGDVSVSYGGTAGKANDSFYSTAYGQRYLDLRKNCIGRPIIG